MIILGHAALALKKIDERDPLRIDLEEIALSAQRSADLTRQLLAFARKQTVAPKQLDINNTVGSMIRMLQRLIGEDISLQWRPFEGLWPVIMDPSQLDQILANLCVNARDAIAGNGLIVITSQNAVIDSSYCLSCPDAVPGDYVCLTIKDNGRGMNKETLSHIFEPFFTTKGIGQGTGLGLASVYGALRQNNGFILVDSEEGCGTSVAIYLPRHRKIEDRNIDESEPVTSTQGNETILLVEDDEAVILLAEMMLKELGYTVIRATMPSEALNMARNYPDPIHLLITDVIMPEMNGRDLAEAVLALHPGCRQLYMSGYTAELIDQRGVLNEEVHFIQKPFSLNLLSKEVREALEGADYHQGKSNS
jgi:CheY-like chemotaxis protein